MYSLAEFLIFLGAEVQELDSCDSRGQGSSGRGHRRRPLRRRRRPDLQRRQEADRSE